MDRQCQEKEETDMSWIFYLAAAGCLIYYIVILIYSGVATSLSWIWLVAAGMFAFLAFGTEYYIHHSKKIPLWIPVSIMTTVLTGIVVTAAIEILIFTNASGKAEPDMDYVIVLGTQVRNETISDSLKRRLDQVLLYAEDNPNTVFILSGGKGKGEAVTEAKAMYEYLQYNGIPEEKMLKEEFSTNTKENIEYSKTIIERVEKLKKHKKDKPLRVAVLSNDFHIFRAKQLAQKMGFSEIYGIKATSNPVLFVHFCVREALAIFKDKLFGNI